MYLIKATPEKKRLYLKLEGKIDKKEVNSVLFRTINVLTELEPGFDLISEILDYEPLSDFVKTIIFSTLRTVKEHGTNRIISINKTSLKENTLFENTSFCFDYEVETAMSLNDAENMLDFGMEKEDD